MTLGFPIILALTILGSLKAPLWVAAVGAAALTALVIFENSKLNTHGVGHLRTSMLMLCTSVCINFSASVAALLVGRFAIWIV